MKTSRAVVVAALLCVPGLVGCGTVMNLSEESRIYGGTLLDTAGCVMGVEASVGCFAETIRMIEPQDRYPITDPLTGMWLSTCAVFDFPFSLVADTITLPWTVPATLSRWAKEAQEKKDEKESQGQRQDSSRPSNNSSGDSPLDRHQRHQLRDGPGDAGPR
jgi:uncharacterized protein YceK